MWSKLHPQTQHKQYEILKPTEKEFNNYHLLHTVKQINGQIAFKQIYERAFIIRFLERISMPEQYSQEHFGYILHGEVFVYKHSKNKYYETRFQHDIPHSMHLNEKVFITCHKAHEIFGLQEYPLNWSEELIFEATEGTKVLLFPLDLSLTSFKKIFNMSMIQYRAEILKKTEFFKTTQIEKLKKIALYSKRLQGTKGQILIKKGDEIQNILIIINGEIAMIEGGSKKFFKKEEIIGLDEMNDKEDGLCNFFLSCATECQVLSIPKIYIMKMYKIRYRLEERESIQLKSRRQTQYQNVVEKDKEKQKDKEIKIVDKPVQKITSVFFKNDGNESRSPTKFRPNTSTQRSNIKSKDIRFSTFYDNKNFSTPKKSNKNKTEGSEQFQAYLSQPQDLNRNQSAATINENISLGELCLRKFLNRKQRRQNCEIMKYLRSNAPELKLNPSKQYALVKPLHVCDSSYIKNLKRKLKRSYIKTGGDKSREQQKTKSRFSFFFKEETIET